MGRAEELISAADKFVAAHNHWVGSPDTTLITQAYEDALVECVREFSDGDLPANCRALAAAVDDLAEAWKAYEGYVSQSNPMPKDVFWTAVQRVVDERTGTAPFERKPLESVRMLLSQKVTPRQIATIYAHNGVGPFLKNGVPQEHLIEQERRKPGSVIPADWVHPADEARLEEHRRINEKRIERLEAKRVTFKPCPESTEELLRQKVFPNQIAQMRGIPVEEVLAEATRLGISTAASAKDELELARQHNPHLPAADDELQFGDDEEEIDDLDGDEEATEGDSDPMDLDAQILAKAEAGMKSADIARELGVSPQKAAAVMRQARREREAKEPVEANG